MIKLYLKRIFQTSIPVFFIIFLGFTNTAHADHIMGADITYTCLGSNTYSLQLKIFRDCSGIPMGNSISVDIFSPTCGSQFVSLNLVPSHSSPGNGRPNGFDGVVITPTCPGQPDVCNNDPGANYGIEEYIYKGNVTLTCAANDYTVTWTSCCRNFAITTLNNPGGTGFYVNTNLNNTLQQCNSSPNFLTRPTPFICINQVVNYSHGVSDPDNDSLVFSLVNCQQSSGGSPTSVNYAASYSGTNPLTATGLSIDPSSGALVFTPTAIQVGVLCVKVEEYRNGVKIGETVRDMQFRVINCPTNPPVVSGIDSTTNYTLTVCANDPINFTLYSFDPDTAAGGVPTQNISMYWNGGIQGANFVVDTMNPPRATFSWTPTNASAGSNFFTVTVEDDACPLKAQNIFTYVVNVEERPPVSLGPSQVRCGPTDTVTLVANTATPSTNVTPVSYQWSPVYNISNPTSPMVQVFPDTTTIYKVVVTYSNGCTETDSVIVEYISGIDIPAMNDTAICQGGVQLDATVASSTATFDFLNNNTTALPASTTSINSIINVSGVSPAALATGAIASVCVDLEMLTPTPADIGSIDISLMSPSGIMIDLSSGNGGFAGTAYDSTCFSMTAATPIVSGTPPFVGTYIPEDDFNQFNSTQSNGQWALIINNNSQFFAGQLNSWSITFTDPTVVNYSWSPTTNLTCNNCPNPIASPTQTTTYVVTATSTNGCVDVDSVTIVVASNLPATIITCQDITPFSMTYCWDTIPGAIGYEISLDGGATWLSPNNGNTCHDLTGLTPSTAYPVQVRGISTCSNVMVGIASQSCSTLPCNLAVLSISQNDESCAGASDGHIIVTSTGGTAPITFNLAGFPPQTDTAYYLNINGGTYNIVAIDSFGCMDSMTFTINAPISLTTTTSSTNATCFSTANGTGTVSVMGGNGNYSYNWSNGDTTVTATNLGVGTHYVTVSDLNGCSSIDSVVISSPSEIIINTLKTDVSCFNGTDGSASATPSGGTAPYTYAWNTTPIQNTQTAINLPAGTYIVTVTDANNCSATASVTINQPPTGVSTSVTFTDVSCFAGNDGVATVNPTGGSGNYTYQWSNNQFTQTITGLIAGTYYVSVYDVNNCFVVDSAIIDQPAEITLIGGQTPSSCFGGNDGTATIAASGGTPTANGGYTYTWNTVPPQNTQTALFLTGGQTYSVTVTDVNGCFAVENITIGQPQKVQLTLSKQDISCNGFTDGSVTVSAIGGTPGYTYQWSANTGNDTLATSSNLGAGIYSVTVSDFNGCTASGSIAIEEPEPLAVLLQTENVLCKGESTGTINAFAAGGVPFYTLQWDARANNQSGVVAENLAAGTYAVTVTDANGCTIIDSATIAEPAEELTASMVSTDVSCFGERDGTVRIVAQGGRVPYEYSENGVNYTGTNVLVGLTADDYVVHVRDDNGCEFTDTVTITEPDEIIVDAGPDLYVEFDEEVPIVTSVTNGTIPYYFEWRPAEFLSCDNCPVPMASPPSDQEYLVVVTDANGCQGEDNVFVRVQKVRRIYVATGFSPNGDGINDALFVQGGDGTMRVVDFRVYDRWGELVFETADTPLNDPTMGWDGLFKGQKMNSGVYSWMITVEFSDGEQLNYQGNSTLVR